MNDENNPNGGRGTVGTGHRSDGLTDAERDQRIKAIALDLNRIAAGWRPNDTLLAHAPVLNEWSWAFYPGGQEVALCGSVNGHPRFPDGHAIVTSPILVVDIAGRWARTHSRFYRLGRERSDA